MKRTTCTCGKDVTLEGLHCAGGCGRICHPWHFSEPLSEWLCCKCREKQDEEKEQENDDEQ